MATRKDYIATAKILAANPDEVMRAEQARHFADLYAADNPRFDRARFLAACGVTA